MRMYVYTYFTYLPHLFLQGIVGGIQDMFGYIECSNKEVQAAFHLSEVMDTDAELTVGDEVEYSPVITKDKVSMSVIMSVHTYEQCIYVRTYVRTCTCAYIRTYTSTCLVSTWVSTFILMDSEHSSFCPLLCVQYMHMYSKSILIVRISDKKY